MPAGADPGHPRGFTRFGFALDWPNLIRERWLIYEVSGNRIRIVDLRTGRARRRAIPPGCGPPGQDAGRVLLHVCDGGHRLLAVDALTGRPVAAPGLDAINQRAAQFNATISVFGFGRYWIAYSLDTPGAHSDAFRNWHTGEFGTAGTGERDYENLDTPRLVQPLCAPVVRGADRVPHPEQDFFVKAGWVERQDGSIWQCGAPAPIVLRAHGTLLELPYYVGLVNYTGTQPPVDFTVSLRSLKSRHRWHWTIPRQWTDPFLILTRTRFMVGVFVPGGGMELWAWPGRLRP